MTLNDSSVLIFKAIVSFIRDLNEIYGKSQKSLCLYAALIEKTGLIHEEPIKKHIKSFHSFVTENESAILNKDASQFTNPIIRYSEKVFLDMNQIMDLAKQNTSDVQEIWKHLLTLSALLNPSSQAKQILQQDKDKPGCDDHFLNDLIDKIGKHVDPSSANPMESMSSLMSSGVLTEIMTSMNEGVQEGKLDMKSMVGGLQKMIGSLSDMIQTNDDQDSETSILTTS
jgi:hypothetical protein